MKILEYVDEDGRHHKTAVPVDNFNARTGIPLMTVNVSRINWETVSINLHNELIRRGLYSLPDIQRNQQEFINAIVTAVKKPLSILYQEDNQ